jgi:hypothetical protein
MTGPTDTILNAFQMKGLTGAVGNAFYHKDLASYNSGVLMKSDGNWSPSSVGSATLNRPFDSYLTIGGLATPTNTTAADPLWPIGLGSWGRPDMPTASDVGWYNSNPPNLQGRVGQAGNTATDVLLGQFVVDSGFDAGLWELKIGWSTGVSGSPIQFYTGQFKLGPTSGGTTGGGGAVPEPGEWAAMGVLGAALTGLVARKRRR